MADDVQPIKHGPTTETVVPASTDSPLRRQSMPSRILQREVCNKRGCILTCYVNGRKRFRAAPLGHPAVQSRTDGIVSTGDAASARRSAESD